MSVNEEIPQWAKERACELLNEEYGIPNLCKPSDISPDRACPAAFARYIAQHEQPPVDPDLVKAREICARVADEWSGTCDQVGAYRNGVFDDDPEVQFALSALKEARGQ